MRRDETVAVVLIVAGLVALMVFGLWRYGLL